MSEAQIQKQILQYLDLIGVMCWRQNAGAMVVPAGPGRARRGFYRFCSIDGVSDILGVLPGGRFFAIEVKQKGKKPTDHQAAFLDQVNRNGGLGFVARALDDVIAAFAAEGVK